MNNKLFKVFFARFLLVLQLLHVFTPHALLSAANTTPALQETQAFDIGLPSRKVFKEIAESWEGLRPPAFIKNTANISGGSSFDATIRLVGSQKKTLEINRKTKAVAEAIQFLNGLAVPGKALERANCSKRMMSDLQMFHDRGLFKSFNRTILSLGQALQISQFYQGASNQQEAEQRRDFITGLLKTPDAARAIGVRIRCFSKFENQFLRQTMTPRNESLDVKIKALEPSKLFGPLRNSPTFIRWHSRLTENNGYEVIKNAYLLFAVYVAINLFLRAFAKKAPGLITNYVLNGEFLSPADQSITKDVTVELADQSRQNIPGASVDIAYYMARLLLSTQTQRSTLQDSSSHLRQNLKSAAGSLLVGPWRIIPALLMLGSTKLNKKKTAAGGGTNWGSKKERLARVICDLPYPTIPSLTAKTWEEGLDLCSTFPDLVGDKAKSLIDDLNKAQKIPQFCWDGDPASKKARDAFAALASYFDPVRSMLDHGADYQKTVGDVSQAIGNPTLASNLTGAAAGERLLQNPDTTEATHGDPKKAARAQHIPLYGRWKNLTWNPAHWVFGQRATNIFLGNIPYMGWARVLTGNLGAYWKETRLLTSAVSGGLEATAHATLNLLGQKTSLPLGTFTVGDTSYNVSFAPGVVASFATIEKALTEKTIPAVALFSVSTTKDGKIHYLSQAEISGNSELLQGITERLQTAAADKIKAKLEPHSLRSPELQANLVRLKKSKAYLKKHLQTPAQKGANNKEWRKNLIRKTREAKRLKQSIDYQKESIGETMINLSKLAKKPQITSRMIEGNIGLICLALATLYTLGNAKNIERQIETDALDSHMFSSLKPAVALSEMVRQIILVLDTHSTTIPLPHTLKTKLATLVASATPNCKEFAKLAQNKMFLSTNKPVIFGDYGSLRYAYKLSGMEDVQRWLSVCAAFMAEVDSYLAIARLVAEHKDAPNYFYPITFVEQEAPRIELSGFWFPLISAYKSIPNDLTIGDPAHILITGLNGGGKSFALKGLLFTILMSHTFGYGPVKSATMTFFNNIITHLSTTDNAAEGDSCWIAEAKSMGNAIHAMQAPHAAGDKILYIGDELGSGTASAASIQAVASLMDIALEQPHVASIITTHLRPLTELENITNGKVHNYRVGGTVSTDNVIQRKFQLERGRADVNIAELIFNQTLEYGEQKTLPPTGATAA